MMGPRASIALGTIVEASGLSVYLLFASGREVYEPISVAAAAVLFLALGVESLTSEPAYRGEYRGHGRIASALAFASLETVIWINWFIIADFGLYSKYGIGPAFVAAFLLLTALHVIERLTISSDAPLYGAIPTAGAEVLAATTLWIFMGAAPDATEINIPVLGVLTAALLLAIEHWARFEHLRLPPDDDPSA